MFKFADEHRYSNILKKGYERTNERTDKLSDDVTTQDTFVIYVNLCNTISESHD